MSGRSLRFINTLLLVLFCLLGLTGLYGLVWPFPASLFDIHRVAGWAMIALIPWKAVISLRSLSRGWKGQFDRSVTVLVSILLTIATVIVLLVVLMWTWHIGPYYVWIGPYAYSGIGWHWGIAIGLAPFFILHVWRRWPHPKKVDFAGRRQFLKLMGLGAAAVVGWRMADVVEKSVEGEAGSSRFSGSREQGSFRGNAHPVTTASDQGKVRLDPATWSLSVKGTVDRSLILSYEDMLAMAISEVTTTLDCTGGWYTLQTWHGVWLKDLLTQAGLQHETIGIILRGVQDYSALFTLQQGQEILLATHVGGEVLNHSHGFPLRAVVPSRRGWHWVKWLTEIEVVSLSAL